MTPPQSGCSASLGLVLPPLYPALALPQLSFCCLPDRPVVPAWRPTVPVNRDRSNGRSRADWHGNRYDHSAPGGRSQWPWALFAGFALIVFTAVLIAAGITPTGHTIDMALMHFLLFYGGVFALIGLTAAVGVGLLASDRIAMTPSGRIVAQAVHRAVSFGAVGFLLIHIVTEIIARRSQGADAVVPFLAHGRTLYLGLGTVPPDLFLLILVTGILRARFASVRPTWAWRALHSVAYLAWVLGILHGLLAGRAAKPYVDWSYGACVAAVGLALIVRVVAAARGNGLHAGPGPGAAAGRLPAAAAGAARPASARDNGPPRAGRRCPPALRAGHRRPSIPRADHRPASVPRAGHRRLPVPRAGQWCPSVRGWRPSVRGQCPRIRRSGRPHRLLRGAGRRG